MPCQDPALDMTNTENNYDMTNMVQRRILHRVANVNNFWGIWWGSQTIGSIQMVFQAHNQQMRAGGLISDTEMIINPDRPLCQHNGVAIFQLSERSPLPPGLCAKHLCIGRTQIVNMYKIRGTKGHPVGCDEDSACGRI